MKNPAFLLNLSSGSVRTVEDELELFLKHDVRFIYNVALRMIRRFHCHSRI
jgi:hypothetical protein